MASAKAGKSGGEGKGLAIAAIIVSSAFIFLALLIVLGALSYFGVLSPSTLIPEKCAFPIALSCVESRVSDSGITLTLQNGAGRDMTITRVSASSEALGAGDVGIGCSTGAISAAFGNGTTETFTLGTGDAAGACSFRDSGRDKNRYNITVTYEWPNEKDIYHYVPGELLVRKS